MLLGTQRLSCNVCNVHNEFVCLSSFPSLLSTLLLWLYCQPSGIILINVYFIVCFYGFCFEKETFNWNIAKEWVCGLFFCLLLKRKFEKRGLVSEKFMSGSLKHFGYRLPWEESDWNDISRLVLTWPFCSAFQEVTSENQIKNYRGRSEIFFEPECITTAIQQNILTSLFTSLSSRHRTFISAQKVFFGFKWLKRSADELQLWAIFLPTLLARCLCNHGNVLIALSMRSLEQVPSELRRFLCLHEILLSPQKMAQNAIIIAACSSQSC